MTLALLIAAATGAWAVGVGAKIGTTEYATLDQAISSAQDGDIIQLQSDAALTESIIVEKRITIDYNGYIISRVGNTYGGIFWNVDMTFTDSDDTGRGGMKCYYGLYTGSNAKANLCGGRYDDSAETILTGSYNIPTGYEIVNINADGSADADGFISRVVRNYLNDTKTVATMTMPTSDVTVNYELVRDITQKVDVETRIDGAVTERIRIAKDNDGHYKFATKQGWQFAAVDKLDNNKDLTNGELTYTLKMKVGNEYVAKNFDTELCPGTWRLEATANAEKPYEGTAYGPDIELYAGYEITVPAGEYATFYKDENLYTEDENAELYTISEVNATQAVLSDAVQIMPKNTPMLVYNKGTEEKTFMLIPTEDEANQVTAANEFKGTLSTMGMPGSTSITDYYVCTGKAFRWVKNAGTIGANKCWLQIGEQPATTRANTRSIVGGGNTTGIDGIENDESAVEGYYDLNGRKLQGKPTRGGIYIQNGRKVIVR